ncbi:hypothetical protein LWI28_014584 [Acer negundo]|uniref:Uncharacterized protein n=1 Tax=Acer negundo TaxID=4023 RepID=A0AAD5IW22_ACENE|nr:hypothetical protein LWI28_014584 [Acer negundo]
MRLEKVLCRLRSIISRSKRSGGGSGGDAGAVVLKNRSAGDAFVWYSKLFSYLYQFAIVWLDTDTIRWQPPLGRMGMKVEEASKLPSVIFLSRFCASVGMFFYESRGKVFGTIPDRLRALKLTQSDFDIMADSNRVIQFL